MIEYTTVGISEETKYQLKWLKLEMKIETFEELIKDMIEVYKKEKENNHG